MALAPGPGRQRHPPIFGCTPFRQWPRKNGENIPACSPSHRHPRPCSPQRPPRPQPSSSSPCAGSKAVTVMLVISSTLLLLLLLESRPVLTFSPFSLSFPSSPCPSLSSSPSSQSLLQQPSAPPRPSSACKIEVGRLVADGTLTNRQAPLLGLLSPERRRRIDWPGVDI